MAYKIRVDVALTVEVDAEDWADAYGLEFDSVGPAGKALRQDIEGHIREVVRHDSTEAVRRLGVGAEVV